MGERVGEESWKGRGFTGKGCLKREKGEICKNK